MVSNSIDFKNAHGPGRTSVAFVEIKGKGLCLVSGGADGKVVLRGADRPHAAIFATHKEPDPIECLSVDPRGGSIAVGVDNKAQVGDRGHTPLPPMRSRVTMGRFKIPLSSEASALPATKLSWPLYRRGLGKYCDLYQM